MGLPLQGIRVLDFTAAYSGPLSAMMLGDMGADVIKVEPPQGEPIRSTSGPIMHDLEEEQALIKEDTSRFLAINRSKRSLAVDIRKEQGKEIIVRLAQRADVVMESFRPGVMDRLGLGYQALAARNPRLIYASLSGYGETGPLAHRIGGDMWAQAMGGVVAYQGSPDGPPYLTGCMFVDQGVASILAFGIMVALFARERTGKGQHLSTNLLDGVCHLQSVEISDYLIDGKLLVKIGRGMSGMVPGGAYRARDGDLVSIFGIGSQWPAFCKVLGMEHLIADPRFDSHDKRQQNREELYAILDEAFGRKTRAEWQELFRQAGMRVEPCLNYQELCAHPQVEANQTVIVLQHPTRGPLSTIAPPVRLKETPAQPTRPPPLLGQHTAEILLDIGYSEDEIRRLEVTGIINSGRQYNK